MKVKCSFILWRQWQRKVFLLFRQEWVTLVFMEVFTWRPVATATGTRSSQMGSMPNCDDNGNNTKIKISLPLQCERTLNIKILIVQHEILTLSPKSQLLGLTLLLSLIHREMQQLFLWKISIIVSFMWIQRSQEFISRTMEASNNLPHNILI